MRLAELARFTDDVAATTDCYATLLGTEPVHADESVAIIEHRDLTVLVHETYEPAEGELPPRDHVGFEVADVDEAFERLVGTGLEGFRAPRRTTGGGRRIWRIRTVG